jgi:hypothetical protein
VDRDQPGMRRKTGFGSGGRHRQPCRELRHQRRDFDRHRQYQRRARDHALRDAVAAGLLRIDAHHDQAVNFAEVDFAHGLASLRQGPNEMQRVAMADCFQMVFQRLAADRDALFQDQSRFAAGQRITFDRVRAVGQLDIVPGGQHREPLRAHRPQPVQFLLRPRQPFGARYCHRAAVRGAGKLTRSSIPAGSS